MSDVHLVLLCSLKRLRGFWKEWRSIGDDKPLPWPICGKTKGSESSASGLVQLASKDGDESSELLVDSDESEKTDEGRLIGSTGL